MADAKNKKSEEHYTTTQTNDPVNHPAHYTTGKIEVIDYIEDQKLPYHLGNAVKYISRAGKKDKDKTVEDLRKAVWYIERYIGMISRGTTADGTGSADGANSVDRAKGSVADQKTAANKKSSIRPTLSEAFINTEIFIDFESEPIYGEDQAYICCPERFPTVRFQLMPTVGLIEIVDRLRHKLGFKPMYPIVGVDNGGCDDCYDCDDDCCYDFFISLNGFTDSHLDTCIAAVVADSDSVDNEDMYTIDLTEDEQRLLYKRFDEQCRRSLGKTCEELLKEAEEMMD